MSKIIIVTGGSQGIGKDIVRELASDGNTVILNFNKSEKEAIDIQKGLQPKDVIIDIFKADISTREGARKLVEFTYNKYNRIDVLINNAGISQFKMFTDITDSDWENILKTNLYSVFYMSQETVKYMINQKSGNIINISSIWGITGASCESHYAVSKAGVDALTKSLAKELGPSNIRVNSIAPGIINTKMNCNLSKEELQDIKGQIPLEKRGKTQDISKCVKWLIEDEYVTGQVISVNGGWLI